MSTNQTSDQIALSGEKLRHASVTFGNLCVVCGEHCGDSYVLFKAWSGNVALFGELSSTLSFRVPVHTDDRGCAIDLKKRWKLVAYGPLASDVGVILLSAPLAFHSFPLYAGIGGTLLLLSQFFGAYLRGYYKIPLRIRQRAAGLSTIYVFEFANPAIAKSFTRANRELLAEE